MNQKFSDRLVQSLTTSGVSQSQLAQKLGVTKQAVSIWKKGNSIPTYQIIEKIANILGVDFVWLLSGGGSPSVADTIQKNLENAPMVKESDFVFYTASFIPVVRLPHTNIDETLSEDNVIGMYPKKDAESRRYFAVEQKGDMMLPILKNGDLVLIDSKEQVTSGDLACVLMNSKYLIRYYSVLPEGRIILKPSNVVYPDIILEQHEIQAVFKVCEAHSITRF